MKESQLRFPLPTILIYALAAGLWIVLSDRLLELFTSDPHALTTLQTYKGWLFVLASTLLLYSLLVREFRRLSESLIRRRKAEENLRGTEAQYAKLVAEIPVGIYRLRMTTDDEMKFEYVSPRFCEMLGLSEEEVYANTQVFFRTIHAEDLDLFLRLNHEVFQTRQPFLWEGRVVVGGDTKWLLIESSPELVENGDVTWNGIQTDITERKRAEEEKEMLLAQLTQAQKMEAVGRLAGGVAHDFNNILSVILGYTELALNKMEPADPLRAHLDEVLRAALRSRDIIRQLLAFARKQTIAPVVLDLNHTVKGMLKILRRLIGEDIDLVWQPGSGLWRVKMDPSQFDQILANLCVNSRDAIANTGQVTIEIANVVFDKAYCDLHAGSIPGEFVMLRVSDDGCGMDKETLKKVFEPFFTTKERGHGTGLGLATVYGIVEQNSGFIDVYSEPKKGTTFRIYLPRHEGKADDTRPETETEIPKGQGETVLLVEDDVSILNLAGKILEGLGYAVLPAETSDAAIRLAKQHAGEIHLLITDVIMPGINGRDLAQQLLSSRPALKFLFMSGYTADIIAHRGVLDDGVQFLQKPFSTKDMATKVREVLDKV